MTSACGLATLTSVYTLTMSYCNWWHAATHIISTYPPSPIINWLNVW